MSTLNTNYLHPTGREEAWRFSPVKELGAFLDPNSPLKAQETFVISNAPSGVTLKSSELIPASETSDEAARKVRMDVEPGQILEISKNFESSEPIRLTRSIAGLDPVGTRLQVIAGENSHSKVILENLGQVQLSEDIEFVLHQGATLEFVGVANWDAGSIQLSKQHAIVAKDAQFDSTLITLGGKIVRILPSIEFTGPGASANLNGLYFASGDQHLEHRLFVDHNVANAKSRVNYKGALAGTKSRTVWIGDVFIRANAEGTDTYELNRNLLFSDGARADSVPNLEIETGEIVGAGHASTTGKFDEEQLFYLMSRGIPFIDARRLVVRGFFSEILNLIKDEELSEKLMTKIDLELAKAGEI
jgi:Fe-S cluster assembly protein SufD